MCAETALNFLPLNIDLTKAGAVEALSVTSPHSGGTSDSSDTTDEDKPPTTDKQNAQVNEMFGLLESICLTILFCFCHL